MPRQALSDEMDGAVVADHAQRAVAHLEAGLGRHEQGGRCCYAQGNRSFTWLPVRSMLSYLTARMTAAGTGTEPAAELRAERRAVWLTC